MSTEILKVGQPDELDIDFQSSGGFTLGTEAVFFSGHTSRNMLRITVMPASNGKIFPTSDVVLPHTYDIKGISLDADGKVTVQYQVTLGEGIETGFLVFATQNVEFIKVEIINI